MIQTLVAGASKLQNSITARIMAGTLDAIYIVVKGITANNAADLELAYKAFLSRMVINADFTGSDRVSRPFITGPFTADMFRSMGNLERGYMAAQDGCFIQTGRQILGENEGYSLNINWAQLVAGDLPVGASVAAAEVVVRRIERTVTLTGTFTPIYRAVFDDGRSVETAVSNVAKVYYYGGAGKMRVMRVTQNGRDNDLDMSLLRAASAFGYSHEQSLEAPLIVLYEGDLARSGMKPTFLSELEPGQPGGYYIQVGGKADRVIMTRVQDAAAEASAAVLVAQPAVKLAAPKVAPTRSLTAVQKAGGKVGGAVSA